MKHPIRLLRPGRAARVVNALSDWNEPLSADELHEKYCKMGESPFVFYRGTAPLFWSDFADDWHALRFGGRRTRTWLQGDAHAENMGAFNNQTGRLVYGLNDFDESIIADYQYDLWRFAASLVLVARRNVRDIAGCSISGRSKARIVNALCESYLDTMASYVGADGHRAAMTRSFTARNTSGPLQAFLVATAQSKTRKKMLKKWTDKLDGERFFDLESPKLAAASKFEREDIEQALPIYGARLTGIEYSRRRFTVRDIARRLAAGTGSLGTPRYYVLIENLEAESRGYHILDVKRQARPSAYDYLSKEEQVDYDRTFDRNDAERHAEAYRALAKQPDVYLGWMKLHNGFYSVRERSPFKETFATTDLTRVGDFEAMARSWAQVLATDHTRAVRRLRVDGKRYHIAEEVVARTKGDRDRHDFLALVRDVAFEYADVVEADFGYFLDGFRPDKCEDFR